ncbi:MAG TPA: response regulator [Terriglobia bacterium]|jgi:CheY-like chemotaxis protein|nr:response regulator [Terriglobia bacterium]
MSAKQQGEPIRILLVEDNPGDVRLIREALKTSPIPSLVTVAEDGLAALRILSQAGSDGAVLPDLIVLDLNLPKKHGCEVLAELKTDPLLRHIPVVILTSSRSDEDVRRSFENNVNLYLTKPSDFSRFYDVVITLSSFWLGLRNLTGGNGYEKRVDPGSPHRG